MDIVDFSGEYPRPAVLCTIIKIIGSAPQSVGQRMWVTAGKFYGTLGGGTFERVVLTEARQRLDNGADPELKEFSLSRELDQCCGGRVQVFFETVRRRKTVHLLGGGHVGRALAQTLAGMPLDVRVIDAREEWTRPESLPASVDVLQEDPAAYSKRIEWSEDDAACILTHSHELDFAIVSHLLTTSVGYLGLIGSGHKATVFRARLGPLTESWDKKMHCPIGLPLDSKNPKIIAVSIASELLETWGLRGADHTRLPAGSRAR
ncbi:MAG: xanthine dehydrogenase accessory protein XdhC [Elusimicrobia bacterium]|nr:MAG: xanthine dehydrogenase accessory protein XdhC [Elusimicrobiota bacterium]